MKVPEIRFAQYKEPLSQVPLGELAKKSKVINKHGKNNNLLSLSYGKIVQKDIESKKGLLPSSFNSYQIIQENSIIFRCTDLQNDKKSLRVGLSTQEGIISPAYIRMDCDTSKVIPEYLFTQLHYHDSVTKVYYNMGDGLRQTLSFEDLKDLCIYLPAFPEQAQISLFFKQIDSQIQSTTKKIEKLKQTKAASLVSMFPQKGATKPQVRFNGFEGEWEIGTLSQYAKRITRKNTSLETRLPLTISASEGLIAQDAFFNNLVASSNLSGYYLLKRGEFAYNKSYSSGYPFGAVKRLDTYPIGALSTLYIIFEVNDDINHDYLLYFFETSLWHNEVAKRAAEGARNHGLLNIGAEDFLDINIIYPTDIHEQRSIAKFFMNLDAQITLETKRLEKLKNIKTACLDKMFV